MQGYFFRLRWWILLVLTSWLVPAGAAPVCVVSADKVAAFQEASDTFAQELLRNGIARTDVQFVSGTELTDSLCLQDARLIVSLGTEAFRQVIGRTGRTAVIAGLLPRISFERLLSEAGKKVAPNVTALYLDQPFSRQLDLLHMALPLARRVGVLWGPESVSQQALMNTALQSRSMELSEGVVGDNVSLISALQASLRDAEVLLAVADSAVYNSTTVANILLTSYRAKTPVLAFSPAYVKAGALLSVHTGAAQAGLQLGGMAAHFLQTGGLPANQYPVDFTVTTNDYVAHSLGLSLDAKALTERLHKMEKRP